MDRILTLDDLERRIYGESSRSSTTARQTGLRLVLNILYGSPEPHRAVGTSGATPPNSKRSSPKSRPCARASASGTGHVTCAKTRHDDAAGATTRRTRCSPSLTARAGLRHREPHLRPHRGGAQHLDAGDRGAREHAGAQRRDDQVASNTDAELAHASLGHDPKHKVDWRPALSVADAQRREGINRAVDSRYPCATLTVRVGQSRCRGPRHRLR